MEIDPKVAMIIKIVATLANAIANGTLVLTGLMSVQEATTVAAICQVLVTVLGIIMTAYSSSAPGPLAPPDAPAVVAAQKVVTLSATSGVAPATITAAKTQAVAEINKN